VPTLIAFDLDPGEGADLLTCCEVAILLKDVFDRQKMKEFAKVSGSSRPCLRSVTLVSGGRLRLATEPAALELFEQAFELFRAAPLATFAPHWFGTAPFLAALLMFLIEMSSGVFALERLLPMSFLLTLLWVWMQVWQAVYCARLYTAISNNEDAGWNRARIWSVVSIQTATQGMKLVVVPAKLLIALPFAWTFSFFQNVTCFAGASGADLPTTWRRCRCMAAPMLDAYRDHRAVKHHSPY